MQGPTIGSHRSEWSKTVAEDDPTNQPQAENVGNSAPIANDDAMMTAPVYDFCDDMLFDVAMHWGAQPVRLTAFRCSELLDDAPTTSVHIVAFHGGRVLVVCDRKGMFGFPGGRLEAGETRDEALAREVYEEACAYLQPVYTLFGAMKIQCTAQLPNRVYPHPHTYMAMYVGAVRALDPIRRDPAGIILSRALFTRRDCEQNLQPHDKILLREGLEKLAQQPNGMRVVRQFLGCTAPDTQLRTRGPYFCCCPACARFWTVTYMLQ